MLTGQKKQNNHQEHYLLLRNYSVTAEYSSYVSYRVCVLQLPQVDVLHCSLEGAETVAEFIFTGVAEAEVPDVAQVGHPEDKQQEEKCCSQSLSE